MGYKRVANKIVIQQSRTGAIILFLFFLIIIIGWQWVIFGMPKDLQELSALDKGFVGKIGLNSIFYMVAGLPLFLIPSLVKNFRIALAGRTIVIDGTTKKIFRNDKKLLHFSEIQNLKFKYLEDSSIALDFILHNGTKVKLEKIGIRKNVDTYKEDIHDVVQFSENTLDEMSGKDSFSKVFVVIHYIVLVVSCLLLIGSIYAISSSILFTLFGTTTTGKIIDIEMETIERIKKSGRVGRIKKKVRTKSTVYTSTIEYQDAGGTVHKFKSSAWDTGGNVPVVYLKFFPQFARVKSFSGMWGGFFILLVFGVILFFVSQMFNEKFSQRLRRKARNLKQGAMKMDNEWIKVVAIFTIMSLVASALLYLAIRSWRICRRDKNKAVEMISWPTTTASAKDWEVTEDAGFRRKYPGYIPKITCSYYLDGKEYLIDVENKKFHFGDNKLKAKENAEELGKSIVIEGRSTQIYYNPNDPSESVAEIGKFSCTPTFVVVVIVSIFLLIFISYPLFFLGMIVYKKFWT